MVKIPSLSYYVGNINGEEYLMDYLIEYGFLSLFLASFIASISYTANNINANILERKLMTNFEKIKLPFSVAFTGSTILIVAIILFYAFTNKGIRENLLVVFALTLLLLFIVILITDILYSKFKSKKFRYFITLVNGSMAKSEWEIIKMTSSNHLLLKQVDDKNHESFKLIRNYDNLSIRIEKKM